MSSQQRILREVNERIKQNLKQGQLTWLQLDSIPIRQISKQLKSLLQQYPLIEYLTMNDCELTSLNNFPKLDNLSILELSNNQIEEDQLFHLLKCSHISHLMIDENRLRNIEKISILRQLPNLQQLQIAGNRIGDSDFYRQELFDRIPHLKIIDCHDMWGNIAINSDSEGEQQGQGLQGGKGDGIMEGANNGKNNSKKQQKDLLDFLQEQESQSLSSQQQNDRQAEKDHTQTIVSSENSLNSLNNNINNNIINNNNNNNMNNYNDNDNITGSKRIKLQQSIQGQQKQQDNDDQMNHSKVANKRTGLIQQQSSSPDYNFLPFKRVFDYEE